MCVLGHNVHVVLILRQGQKQFESCWSSLRHGSVVTVELVFRGWLLFFPWFWQDYAD